VRRVAPRVALVTGGASGIGAAICAAHRAVGHHVVCLDRAPAAEGETVRVDLSDPEGVRTVAAELASRHAVTDLVHNAGAIRPALLADARVEDLQTLTALHLAAPMLLLQAVLPAMRAGRFGRVVLISSRAALGLPTRSAYAATKAGLIGLARTWALELAGDGITVNVVAPGPIAGTTMFHAVVPAGSEREAKLAASIPVGRLGRPEDVARAAMFFAEAANGFVTGQTLFVCGGSSVGNLAI
jgi:NAD(P)-dependent dehydrogenase (short-subunit alcohol dehydrogenase family)